MVKSKCPSPDPHNVTLDDPVPGTLNLSKLELEEFEDFDLRSMFSSSRSTDHASVLLPTCSPAAMVTSRVPVPPAPTQHRTAVSDLQSVASHLVDPTRTVALSRCEPRIQILAPVV